MPNGTLRVVVSIAEQAAPLAGVRVTVRDESGVTLAALMTGEDGRTEALALPAPDKSYSLDENNTTVRPYSIYDLALEKVGWRPLTLRGAQVFDGQETLARLELLPAAPGGVAVAALVDDAVTVPPHPLFAGNQETGGSGPVPRGACAAVPRMLTEVVVPKSITVHLGAPNAAASNVTVDFQRYIATVASCEVYPTWPEDALRANILAQISLALNRIYTEWYTSRGYAFNITGSPGYDQAYTRGHTVYAVMERLTAELFNTYVRRSGDAEPYFTEYCDGKLVTCPGMKQWGTVDRANEGRSPLEILRYYYGSRVQLVTTNNIRAIPQSYPGTPLRRGDTGVAVNILQRQLSRISKDYPSFGKPAATGTFDAETEACVRAFQRYFSLTVDGVVGRATWYKISYIYVSVKDLAELTSEGEDFTGGESLAEWPGTTLRHGATGSEVELLQFWLSELARFDANLLNVAVDGSFGPATERAVIAFQRLSGLAADGVVGRATWTALYTAWLDIQSDLGGTAYPGTALRSGAAGNDVRLVQLWLRVAAENYSALPALAVDGRYGSSTAAAVRSFQSLFGLSVDGVVGRQTWYKLREVAIAVIERLVEANVAPGQFTGTVRQGSTGTAVRAVQYYLRLLAAYHSDLPVVEVDGSFGPATRNAVIAWQKRAGLTPDGVVGRLTWDSLYTAAQAVAESGAVARLAEPTAFAGVLAPGDSGPAVRKLSEAMLFLGQWLPEVNLIGLPEPTDTFDAGLETAVRSAQALLGREPTGIVGPDDWQLFYDTAASLYAATPAAAAPEPDGVWPGNALARGSAGPAVTQLQCWLNTIAGSYCGYQFVPETGELDTATAQALEVWQVENGLSPLGVVDDATWESLRGAAAALTCTDCPLPGSQTAEEG